MAISWVRTATLGTGSGSSFSTNNAGNALFLAFLVAGNSGPDTFPSTTTDSYGNSYTLIVTGACVTYLHYSTYGIYVCPSCTGSTSLVQTQYVNPDGSPVANGYLLIRLSQDGSTSDGQIQSNFFKVQLDSGGNVIGDTVLPLPADISPSGTYYIGKVYNASGQLIGLPFIVPTQSGAANTFNSPISEAETRSMGVEFSGFNRSVTLDQFVGPTEDLVSGGLQLPEVPPTPPVTIGDLMLGMGFNASGTWDEGANSTLLYTGSDVMLQWSIGNANPYLQYFTPSGGLDSSALLAGFLPPS